MQTRLLDLNEPSDFDTVSAADIEAARQEVGFTQTELASYLDWSPRKYGRTLDAANEKGFVDRDFALAVRCLIGLMAGPGTGPAKSLFDRPNPQWERDKARVFADRRTFAWIMEGIAGRSGEWTSEVTPPLFRLVARRAVEGRTVTYGEAATTLEDAGLTRRVWPRTLYGMPLGGMCEAAMDLARETGVRVPLLSSIVVTAGGPPGEGINGMILSFMKQHETGSALREAIARIRRDRAALVAELQQEVFDFRDWPGVLRALEIETG